MSSERPPLCAEVSRADAEPLGATASCVRRWLLVEYRGAWAHSAVDGSSLSAAVKRHLAALAAEPRSRVLFVRRPDRHEGLRVFAARAAERGAWARSRVLQSYEELLAVDFALAGGEPVDHPLLLVCTHGKHDPCCAKFGRPLYEAVREGVEPHWAWQSSHVGGDRFAGNLVVLPQGLYFGRVEPGDALDVVEQALGGRIRLDVYRGRSAYTFPVQAAEIAVREATAAVGVDDLRLAGPPRGADPWRVRFAVGAAIWEVEVARAEGELTHLTCKARELRRPRRYVAAGPPVRVA